MNLSGRAIGVFIPGHLTEPWDPVKGGIGDFIDGTLTEPWNPVTGGLGTLFRPPSRSSVIPAGWAHVNHAYRGHADFRQPHDSLSGLGCAGLCCDECAGFGCESCGGLGGITDSISQGWQSLQAKSVLGIPAGYALIGGALVAVFVLPMLMGGAKRRRR